MTIAAGASVRVCDAWPELDGPVHVRTPYYLRGRIGTVLRHLGDFANPEDIAFSRPAPLLPLYHVRFAFDAIWDESGPGTLLVEIDGSWLELAE